MHERAKAAQTQEGVRLDKWLWAARFYRTRALAQEAIQGGKVHVDGIRTKPGKLVRVGQCLTIRRGPEEFIVVIRALSERRGPAAEARLLYEETSASVAAREQAAQERRATKPGKPEKWRHDKKKYRDIQKLLGRR